MDNCIEDQEALDLWRAQFNEDQQQDLPEDVTVRGRFWPRDIAQDLRQFHWRPRAELTATFRKRRKRRSGRGTALSGSEAKGEKYKIIFKHSFYGKLHKDKNNS